MKTVHALVATAAILGAGLAAAQTAQPAAGASDHVHTEARQLKWGPVPPMLAKGAQITVVAGDPGKEGPFVVRLKMPAGYKISPHWHPTNENVTVLAGTLSLGMGDTFDPKAAKPLTAGGFALLPAQMHHFAWTKSGATVQVHGLGPFVVNYVNPADDPAKAAPAKPGK